MNATPQPDTRNDMLALVAMVALWLSQPLFDLVGRYPTFLVAHDLQGMGLLAAAAALGVGLPLLLALIPWLLGQVSPTLGRVVQRLLIGALSAAAVLLAVVGFGRPSGALALGLALGTGALAAIAYQRVAPVRSILALLSPAAIAFTLVFLARPGVSVLLKSEPQAESIRGETGRAPVVLIIFDELPLPMLLDSEGQVDRTRFPSLAGLVDHGLWFRNAVSVSDWTSLAVPAILTGRYPRENVPPSAAAHPESLFTWLAPHYPLHAFEPGVQLCPDSLCQPLLGVPDLPDRRSWDTLLSDLAALYRHLVTPEPWSADLPGIEMRWKGFGNDAAEVSELRSGTMFAGRLDILRQFGRSAAEAPPGTAHVLHVLLPHTPYEYLPGPYRYPGGWQVPATDWQRWSDDSFYVSQARRRLELQLQAVDEALGELFADLQRADRYDESLIAIVADHGSSFIPGGPWRDADPEHPSIQDILRVPLVIKPAGRGGAHVDDRPARTIDLLPTLAEMLELELPWDVDGRSLLGEPGPRDAAQPWYTVRGDDLVRSTWSPGPVSGLARATDPAEQGPARSDLLGLRVEALAVGPPADFSAELMRADTFVDLDPDHPLRPALITVKLEGQPATGVLIAVAVNGVVRALVPPTVQDDETLVQALVDPEIFVAGDNRVSLYLVVEEVQRGPILRPIPRDGHDGAIGYVLAGGALRAEGAGAPVLQEVTADVIQAQLSQYFASAQNVEIAGWAVDLAAREPARELLVFDHGQFAARATPDKPAPGLETLFGWSDPLTSPAFELVIPRHRMANASQPCLRLFALGRDGRYREFGQRPGAWNRGCTASARRP